MDKDTATSLEVPSAPVSQSELDEQSFFLRMPRGEVLRIALLGLFVGIVVPLLSFGLEKFFIEPVFCKSPDSFGVCASGGLTAYYIATTLVSGIALILLINWTVFRPILIAAATAVALWGLQKYAGNMREDNWAEYYTFSAVIFASAYLLFYWLMRARSFMVSLLFTIAAVILIHWALIG